MPTPASSGQIPTGPPIAIIQGASAIPKIDWNKAFEFTWRILVFIVAIGIIIVVCLIALYGAGTAVLQAGFQRGGALVIAGLATLLTNALPIAAGTIVLEEPVPSGAFGVLRVLAFGAVTVGAFLLVRPRQDMER